MTAYTSEDVDRLLVGTSERSSLVESHAGDVGDLMARPTRSLIPQLLVMTRVRPGADTALALFVLYTGFNGDDEKRAALRRCGRDVYERKTSPVAVALASEAWQSARAGEVPHVRPRRLPLRRSASRCRCWATASWGGWRRPRGAGRANRPEQHAERLRQQPRVAAGPRPDRLPRQGPGRGPAGPVPRLLTCRVCPAGRRRCKVALHGGKEASAEGGEAAKETRTIPDT